MSYDGKVQFCIKCQGCSHLYCDENQSLPYECRAGIMASDCAAGSHNQGYKNKMLGDCAYFKAGTPQNANKQEPETDEDRSRASGTSGGRKGFLVKWIVISLIAVAGSQVAAIMAMGQAFNMMALLLRIPLAFVGYLVGWAFRWVLINVFKARSSDWKDKLFGMVLPLLVAVLAALIVPGILGL